MLEFAHLRRPGTESADTLSPANMASHNWMNDTFVFEDGTTEHYLGSHWNPFYDDSATALNRLPEILQKALLQVSYSDGRPSNQLIPEDWPRAFYLVWPLRVHGLSAVVIPAKDTNHLVSVFPFDAEGCQQRLTVEKVHVWQSGVEAQIECGFGAAKLTFFDTLYASNRGWYEAGKSCQFILSGIAYQSRQAEDQILQAWNPKQSEQFRELAPEWAADLPDGETMPIHTKGMALFLPINKWDRDDYSFRGPIKSVKEVKILDQPCLKARVTVLRDIDNDDRELDIDIIVTRKVWGDAPPPRVGEDMEGALWLQGYLWYPEARP